MVKRGCFINFTNHPSAVWGRKQLREAEKYGDKIKDIPFPRVSALATEEEITQMAQECVMQIKQCNPAAVLCQGEFTLAYQVISMLLQDGILVVAACSDRVTVEEVDEEKMIKHAEFQFVKFREFNIIEK